VLKSCLFFELQELGQKMSGNKKERFSRWKERHEALWQFIMFALVGCITSVVDLGSFALFNFWIFTPYRQQAFSWWLIDYSLENGGKTAFLAFACSNAISQTFNFFMQRKATFKATNNVAKSAVMYVIMVALVYVLQLYLPTLIRVPVVGLFGEVFGDILVKMSTMTLSFLITFPINKWVIMRKV